MTTPSLDIETVRSLAKNALEALPGSVVYADRALRPPGTVEVGTRTVATDHATVLVFRDDMPGANWMHPAAYALVDATTRTVVTRADADRPPVFGFLPDSWVVVSDPDGRADLIRHE